MRKATAVIGVPLVLLTLAGCAGTRVESRFAAAHSPAAVQTVTATGTSTAPTAPAAPALDSTTQDESGLNQIDGDMSFVDQQMSQTQSDMNTQEGS